MENELDPKTTQTDEKEAIRSLDDTTIRPLPEVSAVWEPLEPPAQAPAPTPSRSSRARTIALVVAVAIVSFVAGGITARLSSQVPVLFAKAPETTESTASYEQRYAPANPVDEAPEQEQDSVSPQPLDTGYDTTDDSWDTEDEETDKLLEEDDEDEDEDEGGDGSTLRWFTDDEGDNSISYDTDDQRVTLDYNGYDYSFTLEDFLNDDSLEKLNQRNNSYDNDNGYDSYNTYEDRRRYDSGTGYDSTDAERDSYGWRGWGGYGTYGYHT